MVVKVVKEMFFPLLLLGMYVLINSEMRGFPHLSAGLFTRFKIGEGPKVEEVRWDVILIVGHQTVNSIYSLVTVETFRSCRKKKLIYSQLGNSANIVGNRLLASNYCLNRKKLVMAQYQHLYLNLSKT